METSLVREKKWSAAHGSYINVGLSSRLPCKSQLTGLWLSNLHDPKKLEVTEYWRDEAEAVAIETNPSEAATTMLAKGMPRKGMATKKGIAKKPAAKGMATKKLAKGMATKKGMAKKPAANGVAKKPAASMARSSQR